jgi:hypothetical protein
MDFGGQKRCKFDEFANLCIVAVGYINRVFERVAWDVALQIGMGDLDHSEIEVVPTLVDKDCQAQKSEIWVSAVSIEDTIRPFFPANIFSVPREPSLFKNPLIR